MKLPRFLALLALGLPLALSAQNTVFNDSFAGDLLNPASYPAVTPTTTGWAVLTNKNSPAPTESGGVLTVNMAATTSGFVETQALFAAAPVQLLPGTFLELTATFVPTNLLTTASDNLIVGLYNSGGSAPLTGLLNSGLSSALSNFSTGGAKGWIGFHGNIPLTGASPRMLNRNVQTAANNTVQDVVVDSQSTSVGYSVPAGTSASSITAMSTTLANGATYTLDYKLSLSADGLTLTAAVSLYNGTGTTGSGANTLVGSYTGRFTGTALLTKNFDALAIGWRADAGGSSPSNLAISALAVKTTGGAPWFITPPPATLAASLGSSATLTTVVGGTVASYQWQVSTDGGGSFTNLNTTTNPSAATAVLTISSVQNSDAGLYRLVVINAAGTTTSTTTNVTVTSSDIAPTIINNPVGATVVGGVVQTFSVTANGTSPLAYQWEKSTDGVAFAPIAGATGASYTIASTSLLDEGYYRVTVTNVAGSATSTAAQLVVNQPLTITVPPVGAALHLGDSYTLSVTALGKPAPTYQWYLNGAALSGATGSSYTIGSASAANAGIYTVVASNTAGDSATSSGAAVAVISPTLVPAATTPVTSTTSAAPDTRLTLTFNQPVAIGLAGTIKIYDAATPGTPVDTIDLVAALNQMRTLRAASTLSTQALPVQTKTIGGITNFNYYPLTISGNTATIYPRNGVLTYGHTYYVTIDPGVFTDSTGLSAAGISDSTGWRFTTKSASPSAGATQFTVAADGSGDFTTVQAALDFVPANNTTPRTILIKKGTYFEQVAFQSKHALTIVGEDSDQTVIVYPNNNNFNNASGVYHRGTFYANSVHDCTIANLTVNNTTPQNGSQAEALIVSGSSASAGHNMVTHCKFFSFQDTVQFNKQIYVSDCTIFGDVDFMWGDGPAFFDNCDIRILRTAGFFTQVRNGNGNHGFVFSNCRFTAPAGITGTFFGRIDPTAANFPFSEVAVLDSQVGDAANNALLGTATGVSGANYLGGWWLLNNVSSATAAPNVHNWTNNLVNASGAALTNPNGDLFTTMPTDATTQANYRNATWVLNTSLAGVVNGTWSPALAPIVTAAPVAQTVNAGSSVTLSVTAVSVPPPTYQWRKNGVDIPGATGSSYTVASATALDADTYSVVVTNAGGSVTTAPVALLVNGGPPVITQHPVTQSALAGTNVSLSVFAVGNGPFTYQWLKAGAPITGATGPSLLLTNVSAADAADYTATVTNANGSDSSHIATVTLATPAAGFIPVLPTIPTTIFSVTDYGAIADGVTDNTAAIAAAITAAKNAGGGIVEFLPAAGAYLSGPIAVGSNIDLQVDGGATLKALPFGTYPNPNTHFITFASGASNIAITGNGTIDGDGSAWWTAFDSGLITARPRLIQFTKDTRVLVTGVTFKNSPNFNLAFSGANNNVTIFGVSILAPGDSPNTDGMDLAGSNFLVQNCYVSVGDDNVVAKPGSVFCSNLVVANCAFGTGHGVSVGGQTNVGLDGMLVTNCTFNGTSTALRLKADPTQGGPVQNITFSNLTMTNVQYPILFYSYYNLIGSPGAISGSSQTTPAKANAFNVTPPNSLASSTIPTWKNITVTNLTVTNGSGYSMIWGLPTADALIANVTLNNVNIQGGAGLELYDAANIQLTGTNSVGPILTANALAITGQPASQTINVGDSVTFSATAVGGSGTNNTGLTYQWNLNGVPLANGAQADGSTISGATTPTLTVGNAHVTLAGNYTLTASTTLDGFNTTTNALVANSLPVSATSSAATLTVNPLPAAIALSNLALTYDGTPQNPVVTTSPAGISVTLTYDAGTAPVNAGSYSVVATLADANYVAAPVSEVLTIQPAAASVTLSDLAFVYNGTPRNATATTVPAGLTAQLTYDGGAAAPVNAGSYAVVATITDPNYVGGASGTLSITKAVATVTLGNLSQTYDGAPRLASALTNPGGLAVAFSYDGGATAPVNAGTYAVTGVITDPNYTGSASGTLTIAKATATVTFTNLAQVYDGSPKPVTATTAPAGLAVITTYNGGATAPTDVGSYAVATTVDNPNYAGSANGTLVISNATATVTLGNLVQGYDGTPKPVTVTTTPANLAVTVTYNGSATVPKFPGSYAVVATINAPNYQGTANGTLVITTTAIVRHAPTLNGGIDGSLQVTLPENATLNGGALITGDLLMPGTPSVQLNGHPVFGGIIDADGSANPSTHKVTLNGNVLLGHLVRRIDAVSLPVVAAPPAPTGTRNVSLNNPSQTAGDFATVRNLTLNGNGLTVAVPAGTYGSFTLNGDNVIKLGVAGATEPAVYNLQGLTLNGSSEVQIVGPVIINVAGDVSLNGSIGTSDHPDWLVMHFASGGLTLNGSASCDGYIVAPNGTVTLNGNSTLTGGVICDRLTINGNGLLSVDNP